MPLQKIVSFGFRHQGGGPNVLPGVVVVDVRRMFRNPHRNPALRQKTGLDPEVQADVMKTPEFKAKYEYLKEKVSVPGVEVAYIGCTGGHHRSVFLAEKLAKDLGVPVEHRDLEKP